MPKIVMAFDMRAPAFGTPAPALYATSLEMAQFADERGFDLLSVSEHHGSEDGYLPAPFVLGAAMAARTRSIRIMLGAVILPLHDPIKIAEQIAVLDLVSAGRLEVTFGAGYSPSEFEMFSVPLSERGRRLDEGLEIILHALAGERFKANGREIFVRPLPVQRPHPPMFIGGGVEASARRAARLGLGLAPMNLDIVKVYASECRKLGREPGSVFIKAPPMTVYVTEDPEKGWAEIAEHAIHVAKSYAGWGADQKNSSSPLAALVTPDAVRASKYFVAVTPDECVALADTLDASGTSLCIYPLLGGLEPSLAWKSLELFADKVLPRIKTRSARH